MAPLLVTQKDFVWKVNPTFGQSFHSFNNKNKFTNQIKFSKIEAFILY